MSKVVLLCIAVVMFATGQEAHTKLGCKVSPVTMHTDWITIPDNCTVYMKNQVMVELNASMTYFAMGAYFSKDTVNRPGFANFFFESASEERDHAMKIIRYLLMRGGLTANIDGLINNPNPIVETWANGLSALKDALILEANVTRDIRAIATVCENQDPDKNDYHLVDWLTGDFLTEQYKGQRDLAGKISNLGKMMDMHGVLGEFIFDKKLLSGNSI